MLKDDPEMLEMLGLSPEALTSDPPSDVLLPSDGGKVYAAVGGAYDAANRFDRELALFNPPASSVDGDLLPEKDTLDINVRDTRRNDAYMHGAGISRQDSVVGELFLLNSEPDFKYLGFDDTWAQEFQEEVESKFTLYAESPRHFVDAGRRMTLTQLTRLAVSLDLWAGEVLSVSQWDTEDRSRPFSSCVLMIDTDRLSDPEDGRYDVISRERLRKGVLRNRVGAPIGYYIENHHPGDPFTSEISKWEYVPARTKWGRPLVYHSFDTFRPDQSRGVSAIVSSLKESRLAKKFRDIVLQNAVVQSTYAATIESELPSSDVFAQLGGGPGRDDFGDSIRNYSTNFLSAAAEYQKLAKNNTLNGVVIPHLFPGTKLNLQPAGEGGPLGTDFENSLLRYMAASFDMSVEEFTKNFSTGNYSTLKAGAAFTGRSMRSKKRRAADPFASFVYSQWLEEAIAKGEITSLPRNAPSFWDGLNREAYCGCTWIGSGMGQIDELKETQASALRVKENLSTDQAECARLGRDYRKVYAQRAREKNLRESLGIEEDQSKMMNAVSGASNVSSD